MWTYRSEELADGRGVRFVINRGATAANFEKVLGCWQTDAEFRLWFNTLLADLPYVAFRWETPPVTTASLTRVFEFVVLDEPGLSRRPDPQTFAEQFRLAPERSVVEFHNLGRDAILVVPCPISDLSAYGHLAAFVRLAPEAQRHELWRTVGATMARRVNTVPVWLSTAGAGVSWLHVRLDNRPKYYGFAPYRQSSI